MKKRLLILPLLAGFALASCDFDIESLMFWKKAETQQKDEQSSGDDKNPEVKDSVVSVSVTSSKTSYQVEDSVQLSATVTVTGNAAKTVTWTSSNTSVATVSSSGSVSFLAAGQVTITATSTVDTSKKGSVTFTVTEKGSSQDEVVSVNVSSPVTSVELGADPVQLNATVTVKGDAAKTVTWTSSNTSAIKVSDSGLVTFVGVGQATITATSTVDTSKKGSVTITVKEKSGEVPESVTYAVTFKENDSDSNTDIKDSDGFLAQVEKGADYIASAEGSKVYSGKNGLKLGSSKAAGSVTFTLSSAVKGKIEKIKVDTAQYSSDKGVLKVLVNGVEKGEITPSDGGTIKDINEEITSITFETTKNRAYLSGFSLIIGEGGEGGGGGGTPVEEDELLALTKDICRALFDVEEPTLNEDYFFDDSYGYDNYYTGMNFGTEGALDELVEYVVDLISGVVTIDDAGITSYEDDDVGSGYEAYLYNDEETIEVNVYSFESEGNNFVTVEIYPYMVYED